MAFNINNFNSNALKGGGARPTLFEVRLNSPINTADNLNGLSSLLVESSSIPTSTVGKIEVPYMGRKMSVAGDRTFDAWQVTILNDEDFAIRKIMEEWHNKINSLEGNLNTFGSSAPTQYKRDAVVIQYGKAGNKLRSYTFKGIFPVEVSAIDLDWNRTDEIERFSVAFSIDYYEINTDAERGPGVGLK
jgi:hypothetical protein